MCFFWGKLWWHPELELTCSLGWWLLEGREGAGTSAHSCWGLGGVPFVSCSGPVWLQSLPPPPAVLLCCHRKCRLGKGDVKYSGFLDNRTSLVLLQCGDGSSATAGLSEPVLYLGCTNMSETASWSILVSYLSSTEALHQACLYWKHFSQESSDCYGNTAQSGSHFSFLRSWILTCKAQCLLKVCFACIKAQTAKRSTGLAFSYLLSQDNSDYHTLGQGRHPGKHQSSTAGPDSCAPEVKCSNTRDTKQGWGGRRTSDKVWCTLSKPLNPQQEGSERPSSDQLRIVHCFK